MSLLILCLAAAALVAFGVSALVALSFAAGGRLLDARAPAAQARLLFCAALLPAFATAAAMIAALAPSFGWIADHCNEGHPLHDHPHLCVDHGVAGVALPVALLALVFAGRAAATAARTAFVALAALRARRALMRSAVASAEVPGAHLLPMDAPLAFVLGVITPAMFVSRGLFAGKHREHADSAIAHERAHLRRGDPLRRLIASIAFCFHLPGVAWMIERRLARAHEMAADEEAALSVGSRARVADALVHLARERLVGSALAFGASDVEARVHALLDGRPRRDRPRARDVAAVGAAALAAVAAGADAVHHALETLLGLLG